MRSRSIHLVQVLQQVLLKVPGKVQGQGPCQEPTALMGQGQEQTLHQTMLVSATAQNKLLHETHELLKAARTCNTTTKSNTILPGGPATHVRDQQPCCIVHTQEIQPDLMSQEQGKKRNIMTPANYTATMHTKQTVKLHTKAGSNMSQGSCKCFCKKQGPRNSYTCRVWGNSEERAACCGDTRGSGISSVCCESPGGSCCRT